jgi:hypothetical protein
MKRGVSFTAGDGAMRRATFPNPRRKPRPALLSLLLIAAAPPAALLLLLAGINRLAGFLP